MIWLDRLKYTARCTKCSGTGTSPNIPLLCCEVCGGQGETPASGPGDVILLCAACQATLTLTLPLAWYVIVGNAIAFEKEHTHGRQPGEPLQ